MAAKLKQGKGDNNAFMACILRVNIDSSGWRRIVTGLAKIQGVTSFRMDEDGLIELSGTVDPTLLLEMLASSKAAKLVNICWWQSGQCYSNLYIPTEQKGISQCSCCRGGRCQYNALISGGYGNYGGDDQRYLHYGQYSANRPKPKPQYQSFQKPSVSGEKKAPTRTGEAVECCCLM